MTDTPDQDPLPETPRNDRIDPSVKKSPFTPAVRWVGQQQIFVLLVVVAVVVPLLALYWVRGVVTEVKKATWVYSVDSTGAITYAPVAIADPESVLFKEIALQAIQNFFTRNPRGSSFPEFMQRLFTDSAMAEVQKILKEQKADRERRNLFDHPEISKVELRDAKLMRYRASGYIVRSGAQDGLPLRDIGDFFMTVELTPQPAAADKGRYPFAVRQFAIKITWRSDGSIEEWPKK